MLRIVVVAVTVFASAGCSFVTLRHPQTAARVHCGRVPMAPWLSYPAARAQAIEEGRCVEDARAQGFVPVSEQ